MATDNQRKAWEKYRKSPKGIQNSRERQRRYRRTEKGKQRIRERKERDRKLAPNIEYMKEYLHTYFQRPEVKKRQSYLAKQRYESDEQRNLRKTPEYKMHQREIQKKYTQSQKVKEYKARPIVKIRHNIRVRMKQVIQGKKADHAMKLVGCNVEFLMNHLESTFKPGMTWNNYGKWHIDHIIPLALYGDLLLDAEWQKEAFHWSNLQPLWAAENISKHAKLVA
jgi:hypothetical protein